MFLAELWGMVQFLKRDGRATELHQVWPLLSLCVLGLEWGQINNLLNWYILINFERVIVRSTIEFSPVTALKQESLLMMETGN